MHLDDVKEEWTEHVLTVATDRFERRLAEELAITRVEFTRELHGGLSNIRREMADLRVEILRWSFLFWLGQITVVGLMLSYLLRALEQ
jgi:hypothetical protein